MHLPVTLLRWPFGPHPPNAKAGVTADTAAMERMMSPNSVVEDFFMQILPFECDKRAEPQQVMLSPLNSGCSTIDIVASNNLNLK
ncbi:MAG TPA: hypothetical protein VMF32_05070 [Xanthobacteraceae bacterium]|nr:hypothetical protein [Xanthobacteraceae bacterium]